MKSNDRLLILGTLAYSFLFYDQNAGVNFLIFTLVFVAILLARDKSILKQRSWLFAALMCIVSAVSVLVHSSVLAIISNIVGLLLLSAFAMDRKTSFIFSFLFSCFSIVSSFVFVGLDIVQRKNISDEKQKDTKNSYKNFLIFISVLICLVFFAIYRSANPLFAQNTEWINFNFISFPLIIFTVFGFFLVYGLFYHQTIPQIVNWENSLPTDASAYKVEKESDHKVELSAGTILFCALNVMLLILNIGDVNTIWLNGVLPTGISHSDFVHNGVSLIILSIIIAVGLIMVLFRHNFQAFKTTTTLKWLVYLWVIQNLIMLFSTACRNQLYIHDYNLTYKRVGVYVWLFLAGLGLVLTAIKVFKIRSNWFLIRSNFFVWFCFLSLSSTLNWDLIITRYNLNNKSLKDVDFYYLFSLSDCNIPELIEVSRHKNFVSINGLLKNYVDTTDLRFESRTFRSLMKEKIRTYLLNYNKDWRSWDFRDKRIMNSLGKQ